MKQLYKQDPSDPGSLQKSNLIGYAEATLIWLNLFIY